MTTRAVPRFNRRALIAVAVSPALAVVLATVDGSALAAPAIGPDVTVFQFTDIGNYGSSSGFAGYSIGTRSCNRGDTPLNWCDQASGCAPGATTKDHPVIAQNLYRLKGGRFEQIGMSWLKHGSRRPTRRPVAAPASRGRAARPRRPAATSSASAAPTPTARASTAAGRWAAARRSTPPLATTPSPRAAAGRPTTVYDERIKVATTDLDPAQNAGATYWAEGHYIAPTTRPPATRSTTPRTGRSPSAAPRATP